MTVMLSVVLPRLAFAETLRGVSERVIATHPDIQRERANVEAVVQAKKGATGDFFPTVDMRGAFGRENSYERNLGGQSFDENVNLNRTDVSVVMNQNLFKGFASISEYDRQVARLLVAELELDGTTQDLLLKSTSAYLGVLRSKEILELSREFVTSHEEIFSQVKARFDSGIGSETDMEQVHVRLANAKSNEVAADNNYQDSLSHFKAVVGTLPGKLSNPEQVLSHLLPLSLPEAIALGMRSHPVLQAANVGIKEGQAQYEASKSPYYPTIDLEVSGNMNKNQAGFNGTNTDVALMLRMNYNLFNGTKDLHKKQETAELVNVAKSERDQTKREIEESIRLSWRHYEALGRQLPYLKERLSASITTLEGYTEQYKVGRRTLLDVLDTKTEAYESEIDKVHAEYDYHYSQYRILNSIGSLSSALRSSGSVPQAYQEYKDESNAHSSIHDRKFEDEDLYGEYSTDKYGHEVRTLR